MLEGGGALWTCTGAAQSLTCVAGTDTRQVIPIVKTSSPPPPPSSSNTTASSSNSLSPLRHETITRSWECYFLRTCDTRSPAPQPADRIPQREDPAPGIFDGAVDQKIWCGRFIEATFRHSLGCGWICIIY